MTMEKTESIAARITIITIPLYNSIFQMWSDENDDELVICATQTEKTISLEETYDERLNIEKESSVPETQRNLCEGKETTQEILSESPELCKRKHDVSNTEETT